MDKGYTIAEQTVDTLADKLLEDNPEINVKVHVDKLIDYALTNNMTIHKIIMGRYQMNGLRLMCQMKLKMYDTEMKERNVRYRDILIVEDPIINDIVAVTLDE